MMKKVFGLVQLNSKLNDKETNLKKLDSLISKEVKKADLYILPEFFNIGYDLESINNYAENLAELIPEGETTQEIIRIAKKYNVSIVANILEKDPLIIGKYYDTSILIDESGKLLGKYRKIFVFPKEKFRLSEGTSIEIIDWKGIKIGLSICYDHAFPELYRIMALRGAQILIITSAVPKGFEKLVEVRTSARAQDNQLFAIGVNAVGKPSEDSIPFCGNSIAVDPHGDTLIKLGDEEDVIANVSIDTDKILKERFLEPSLRELKMLKIYDGINFKID
jgi:predicted amidohydrolase